VTDDDRVAPGFVPEACDLPGWRRGFAQGAGYTLPSLAFLFIPIYFLRDSPQVWVVTALMAGVGAFMLGTSWVLHLGEARRWLWLAGLILLIMMLGIVTDGEAKFAYFAPFPTTAAALLIRWQEARLVIVLISLAAGGWSLARGDIFGVVLAIMAATIGSTVGLTLQAEHARRRAEVAGRDLHDILGHSLTTVAIKADLAARLVGRDDEAARAEIASLGAVARQALADVRATASGMRHVRLASEIASARSVLVAAGVEARTPAAVPDLDDNASEVLGFAVREAVTNVVRHAAATTCTIECGPGWVRVRDDGAGIAPGAGGEGLDGLRRRVEDAGGSLTVESSGSGTVIEAKLGDRWVSRDASMESTVSLVETNEPAAEEQS
jgi:two-component system sensor histidine kinase DesK